MLVVDDWLLVRVLDLLGEVVLLFEMVIEAEVELDDVLLVGVDEIVFEMDADADDDASIDWLLVIVDVTSFIRLLGELELDCDFIWRLVVVEMELDLDVLVDFVFDFDGLIEIDSVRVSLGDWLDDTDTEMLLVTVFDIETDFVAVDDVELLLLPEFDKLGVRVNEFEFFEAPESLGVIDSDAARETLWDRELELLLLPLLEGELLIDSDLLEE